MIHGRSAMVPVVLVMGHILPVQKVTATFVANHDGMQPSTVREQVVRTAPAAGRPRSIVVVSDSLAIVDEKGPHKFTSPRLYPAQMARRLEAATGHPWRPVVFAR